MSISIRLNGYLVEIPNLKHGCLVKERVLEKAISGWKGKVYAFGHSAIRIHKLLNEIKIMRANVVTQIDRTTTYGP